MKIPPAGVDAAILPPADGGTTPADALPRDAATADGAAPADGARADLGHAVDAPPQVPDAPAAPPADAQPDVASCRSLAECERGQNCLGARCIPAAVSCRAIKNDHPAAPDAVYWVNPAGVPLRAYCDMQEKLELCTELEGEHRGVTRDPTRLVYRMMSVLELAEGTCKLWALRAVADGFPLDQFARSVPAMRRDPCAVLGFLSEGTLGRCPFGTTAGYTTCGFPLARTMRWGTFCSGCVENDGEHDRYMLQGPVHTGHLLTSLDGAHATRCRIR